MKLTNRKNLPDAILRALANDPYDRGDCDFSVTGLLKPARAAALEEIHKDELTEDASNRVFSLLGQATHTILERQARDEDLVEQRYFAKFINYTVSGQIDLLEMDKGILSDFKVTKAYAFSSKGGKGQKPEWIQQLNMCRELALQNDSNLTINKLQIVGILRDWDKNCLDPSKKMKYMAGYPDAEIVTVDIPIWPREETVRFIEMRIREHVASKTFLPKCSGGETWGGNRCKGYCAAAPFCDQFNEALKTGKIGG